MSWELRCQLLKVVLAVTSYWQVCRSEAIQIALNRAFAGHKANSLNSSDNHLVYRPIPTPCAVELAGP